MFLFFLIIVSSSNLYSNDLSNGIINDNGQQYLLKARNFKEIVVYDSSEYAYKKSVEIFAAQKNWDLYIIAQIELGTLNRIQSKTKISDNILDVLYFHKEFNIKDYTSGYAEYLHLKATLLGDYGEFELAINTLDSVIYLRKQESNSDTLLAKTYNNLGVCYYYINKIDKALELYEKALQSEQSKKNPKSEDVATYYLNIGSMYTYKGDFDKALVYYNKVLELNKKRLNTNDPEIADLYYNLAVNYRRLGQFNNALRYNKKAEKIYLGYKDDFSALAYIYLAIGGIHFDKFDFDNAEIYYDKVIKIYEEHYTSTHLNLLHVYFRLAVIAKIEEDYALALEYFNKCLPLTKTINYVYRLRDIASIYHILNESEKVNEYISLAISKINSDYKGSKSLLADILNSKARYLLENGNVYEAKHLIDKVILLNTDSSYRSMSLPYNYDLQAKIYLKLNEFRFALNSYEIAINIFNDEIVKGDSSIKKRTLKTFSDELFLGLLLGKSDALSRLYFYTEPKFEYLISSINNYERALNLFEDMKSFAGDNSSLNISKLNKREFDKIYLALEKLYKISNDQKYLELAFSFAEKFKASLLLSSIKETEAIRFGGIPENLQEAENILDQRISGYKRLIYDENNRIYSDSSKIAIWEENLFYANHEYNQLIDSFQMHYDDYYSLNFNKDVISIAEVQNYIDEDQLLINYKLTDTLLFTITINKDITKFFKTKIDSSFYNDLRLLEGLAHTDFSDHQLNHLI